MKLFLRLKTEQSLKLDVCQNKHLNHVITTSLQTIIKTLTSNSKISVYISKSESFSRRKSKMLVKCDSGLYLALTSNRGFWKICPFYFCSSFPSSISPLRAKWSFLHCLLMSLLDGSYIVIQKDLSLQSFFGRAFYGRRDLIAWDFHLWFIGYKKVKWKEKLCSEKLHQQQE